MSFNIFYSILSELSILLFGCTSFCCPHLKQFLYHLLFVAVSLLGSLSEYLSAWIFGVTLDCYKKCGELKTIKMLIIQPTPFSDATYLEFVIAIFNHFLCHHSSDSVFWSKWFPNQKQVVFSWILIFSVLILNTIYLSLGYSNTMHNADRRWSLTRIEPQGIYSKKRSRF